MTWGRSFICSWEIEPAFETKSGLTMRLLVGCYLTTMASRQTSHQAKFADPNMASLGELSECLLQVNLDSRIESPVVLLHCAHQPQYCSFRCCCEPALPTMYNPVHF